MKKSSKKYFAHETAFIDKPVSIGEGARIWHFSHVMPGARIGSGCNIGQNVYIGSGVEIGNNVKIQNNVSVYEGVTLEDNVFCGPSCVFTNVIRPRSGFPRKDRKFDATVVKKGATIGANATIVCGITVGEHAFIGAGSVVTKDVPSHALYFGNPAQQRGWMCECGEKLRPPTHRQAFACRACKREYYKSGGQITCSEKDRKR
ncbi:MAG: N-acetyltransferase [Candidatus Lindowbacteria bacterium]|nr:N-acetyltransferase [Candidatus Lindowbacteria bacterium]